MIAVPVRHRFDLAARRGEKWPYIVHVFGYHWHPTPLRTDGRLCMLLHPSAQPISSARFVPRRIRQGNLIVPLLISLSYHLFVLTRVDTHVSLLISQSTDKTVTIHPTQSTVTGNQLPANSRGSTKPPSTVHVPHEIMYSRGTPRSTGEHLRRGSVCIINPAGHPMEHLHLVTEQDTHRGKASIIKPPSTS